MSGVPKGDDGIRSHPSSCGAADCSLGERSGQHDKRLGLTAAGVGVGPAYVGQLADHFGNLRVFRVMAVATLVPIPLLTNLPPVSLATAGAVTTLLMVTSSGRFVPAMALITAGAATSGRPRGRRPIRPAPRPAPAPA